MSEYVKYIKDPEALLDYTIDWSSFLGVDTIAASSWDISEDLTNENETFADDATTIWLSGGDVGEIYQIINHITTAANREDDRSFYIQIEQQ